MLEAQAIHNQKILSIEFDEFLGSGFKVMGLFSRARQVVSGNVGTNQISNNHGQNRKAGDNTSENVALQKQQGDET
jgi:hypothetical protein